MDQLKKYQFYVILGVVVAVYAAVYIFVVMPQQEEIGYEMESLTGAHKKLAQEYKKKGKDITNPEIIRHYRNQKGLVQANVREMTDLLKKKDEYLEQWFEGLEISGGLPEIRSFHRYYFDNKSTLIESYREDSSEFRITDENENHSITEILPFAEDKLEISTTEMMKIKQKEFWIIRGILEIVKTSKLKTLSAFKKITTNYQMRDDRLYTAHLVEFEGTINYGDIPLLTEKLLMGITTTEKDKTPRQNLLIEIVGIESKRKDDYVPKEFTITIPHDVEDEKGEIEKWKREHRDELSRVLPTVKVAVKCRVLDYESSTN